MSAPLCGRGSDDYRCGCRRGDNLFSEVFWRGRIGPPIPPRHGEGGPCAAWWVGWVRRRPPPVSSLPRGATLPASGEGWFPALCLRLLLSGQLLAPLGGNHDRGQRACTWLKPLIEKAIPPHRSRIYPTSARLPPNTGKPVFGAGRVASDRHDRETGGGAADDAAAREPETAVISAGAPSRGEVKRRRIMPGAPSPQPDKSCSFPTPSPP